MEEENISTHPSNREVLPRSDFRSITTSSDFVLQWGNRKRVRCMKAQSKNNDTSPTGTVTVQRSTARVDRRVVRSDIDNNKSRDPNPNLKHNNNSGYPNHRQFTSSASASSGRILRNTENYIGMKGHGSNGPRNFASPDRGDKKGNTSTSNNNHKNGNGDRCNEHRPGSGSSVLTETVQNGKKSGFNERAALWLPSFVIALTNKEKEEDFWAIKGCKLPQRPKKRAKAIQRNLNLVSPGAWLCDLTLDRYEVREKKVSKKKPRGLKAMMGNMDSESE